MIVYERRASTVLSNVLRGQPVNGPFLVPANACPILAIALLAARVPLELVDISSTSLEIDPDAALARANKANGSCGGLIFVRPYGRLTDAEPFFREFRRHAPDAIIVDDRCLCSPSFVRERANVADLVLYSTGRAKAVDIGWGGYGLLTERCIYVPDHAAPFDLHDLQRLTDDYKQALAAGTKFEYADMNWLDARKPHIAWNQYRQCVVRQRTRVQAHRRALNAIYRAGIPLELQYPESYQQWRFNIRVANAANVLAALFGAGLFASRHYIPLTRAFGMGEAPNAEGVYGHVINLFNDFYFSVEQAHRAADIVSRVGVPLETRTGNLRYA